MWFVWLEKYHHTTVILVHWEKKINTEHYIVRYRDIIVAIVKNNIVSTISHYD